MSDNTIQILVILGIVVFLAITGGLAWFYEQRKRAKTGPPQPTMFTLTFEAQEPHWHKTSEGQYLRLTDGSTLTYKEG